MTKVDLTDEEKEKLRKAKRKRKEKIEVPLKGLKIAKKDEEKEKGEV